MQAGDLRAVLGRLAQTLREQRMVLAQEGTDDEGAVQRRQRLDARAEPASLLDRVELGMPQAVVDVVRTHATHQLPEQVKLFHRAVRGGKRTDGRGTVLGLDRLQPVGDVLQRGIPVDGAPLPVVLDHRRGEALVGVQGFVGEAVAVGDPAFVDRLVLERHDTHHLVVLDLHDQVRARRIVRADRLAARQLPGAGAVAERLAGERTDRADVNHVARQLGVDRVAGHRGDLAVLAAMDHAQLHHAGHFLAEAHAAGAVNAATHLLHGDQRSDVLVQHDALLFLVARGRLAVAHRQVLQLALASLVTDRAVERVVDEQEFHHRALRLERLVALGAHDHALRHRRGAGRHRLGRLLDVDQAHPAVGRDAELLVIAEVRDVGAGLVGGMHHHAAFLHLDLAAVEFDFNHLGCPVRRRPGPCRSCVRCGARTPRGSA
ncbi:hypothetical protein X551_03268 [Methylibium sp. T29]|nr:hypothetical protein X551_03268 [Methylibium sp. T29]